MKVLYGYKNLGKKLKNPTAAIGIFDGIHIGHKRVLKKVLSSKGKAKERIVITFDPHPRTILCPKKRPLRIMSLEHRLMIFEKMGMDATVIIRFTDFVAGMTPEEFIKKILLHLGTQKVYVGGNFHFGKGKSGNLATLRALGKKHGIDVTGIAPVSRRGRVVSSSLLRKLIARGNISKAAHLLRRPVSILGTVVAGENRGESYGFPTANIDPHQEVLPPVGVYAVKVDVDGKLFDGVMNIGFKPTFFGSKLKRRREPQIEAHIIGFKGNLYTKALEIFFIKKLRREKRFKDEIKLKRQIERDIERAKKFLKSQKITRKISKYKYL
ncbi:MAG: bifunctional riboflavin kinase/FAD synthetase [Candidatus Omnitrophica bacterium]|nr:bifunctional riboflavin kinase/FAD synthetase [Candidatus Omnitrophota bacterium]